MDKLQIHDFLTVFKQLNTSILGNTINDPIIIETQENDYIRMEYAIIKLHSILMGFNYNCIEQKLHLKGDKKIDQLTIEIIGVLKSDQKLVVSYYYDITEPFLKLEHEVSNYLNEKQNSLSK